MKIDDLYKEIKTFPFFEDECQISSEQSVGADGWRLQRCQNLQPQSTCNQFLAFRHNLELVELRPECNGDSGLLFASSDQFDLWQSSYHLDLAYIFPAHIIETPILCCSITPTLMSGSARQSTPRQLMLYLSRAKKLVLSVEPIGEPEQKCRVAKRTLIFGTGDQPDDWGMVVVDEQQGRLEFVNSENPTVFQVMQY